MDLAKDTTLEEVILEKISADLKYGECKKATYSCLSGTFVWTPEVFDEDIQARFEYGDSEVVLDRKGE
jgi:hypothetical protein